MARSVHLACEVGLFGGEPGKGPKTLSASTGSSVPPRSRLRRSARLGVAGGVDGADDEVAVPSTRTVLGLRLCRRRRSDGPHIAQALLNA